jgi:hypothetical protein
VPSFIRSAIELGVPSESSVRLITGASITRTGALQLSTMGGSGWDEFALWLTSQTARQIDGLDLTVLDRRRAFDLQRRLRNM